MDEKKLAENSVIVYSLLEYMGCILKINNLFSGKLYSTDHYRMVYRGQPNEEWDLTPSVYRNVFDIENEEVFLREFRRQHYNECQGLDYFDILVKAQHYGIPTRLLDFTLNPLTALYFASATEPDSDGAVFVTYPQTIRYQNDLDLMVHMYYLFEFRTGTRCYQWQCINFNERVKNKFNDRGDMTNETGEDILRNAKKQSPIFVIPRMTNERIKAQQGLFAVYNPVLIEDKEEENGDVGKFVLPKELESPCQHSYFCYLKLVIPKSKKQQILRDLQLLNIKKSNYFPGIENSLNDLVQGIRNQQKPQEGPLPQKLHDLKLNEYQEKLHRFLDALDRNENLYIPELGKIND